MKKMKQSSTYKKAILCATLIAISLAGCQSTPHSQSRNPKYEKEREEAYIQIYLDTSESNEKAKTLFESLIAKQDSFAYSSMALFESMGKFGYISDRMFTNIPDFVTDRDRSNILLLKSGLDTQKNNAKKDNESKRLDSYKKHYNLCERPLKGDQSKIENTSNKFTYYYYLTTCLEKYSTKDLEKRALALSDLFESWSDDLNPSKQAAFYNEMANGVYTEENSIRFVEFMEKASHNIYKRYATDVSTDNISDKVKNFSKNTLNEARDSKDKTNNINKIFEFIKSNKDLTPSEVNYLKVNIAKLYQDMAGLVDLDKFKSIADEFLNDPVSTDYLKSEVNQTYVSILKKKHRFTEAFVYLGNYTLKHQGDADLVPRKSLEQATLLLKSKK